MSQNARITDLNDFLRANRQSYLSTAPPPRRTHLRAESESSRSQPAYLNPQQRDEIDAMAKKVLREANKAIRELADTEQLRQNTEEALLKKKYGSRLGGLANWAAGGIGHSKSPEQLQEEGRVNTVKEHRENVLFLLRLRLQKVGEMQGGMMETRIMRELEKNKSVLYKARGRMGQELGEPPVPAFEYDQHQSGQTVHMEQQSHHGSNIEDELTPQQLQMFEKENQDMVRHYEETLNQVKYVEPLLDPHWSHANISLGLQRNRWLRSRNYKHNSSKIWQLSRNTLICWLKTHTLQQKMLAVVTRS